MWLHQWRQRCMLIIGNVIRKTAGGNYIIFNLLSGRLPDHLCFSLTYTSHVQGLCLGLWLRRARRHYEGISGIGSATQSTAPSLTCFRFLQNHLLFILPPTAHPHYWLTRADGDLPSKFLMQIYLTSYRHQKLLAMTVKRASMFKNSTVLNTSCFGEAWKIMRKINFFHALLVGFLFLWASWYFGREERKF